MSDLVGRIAPTSWDTALRVDADEDEDVCPWCGDWNIDGECTRKCYSSRVNRMDNLVVPHEG